MKTITVHLVEAGGRRHSLQGRLGRSLMQTAVDAGIEAIAADCGGSLSCATCHVYVDEAFRERVGAPGADEAAMLEMVAAERRASSRLSCQIRLAAELEGLVVEMPPHQY